MIYKKCFIDEDATELAVPEANSAGWTHKRTPIKASQSEGYRQVDDEDPDPVIGWLYHSHSEDLKENNHQWFIEPLHEDGRMSHAHKIQSDKKKAIKHLKRALNSQGFKLDEDTALRL